MIEERTKVRIAGKSITVPVYRDRRTTLRLVKLLDERIKEIEKASDRIDTQAFALQAALSFAAELADAEEAHGAETTETFNDLDRISKTLDEMVKEYRIQSR